MENRATAEKALHWIDSDWQLKALADPVNLLGSRCQVGSFMTYIVINWLIDWLTGWLIDWLIGWLIDWLIGFIQVDHERDVPGGLTTFSHPLLENLDVASRNVPKRLEILLEFRRIEFQHHYLFDRERVLAEQLRDLCEAHRALLELNTTAHLTERISGLKMHLNNLRVRADLTGNDLELDLVKELFIT